MIEEFEADIEARGDELWVLPRGELDLAAAPELQEALHLALASDARSIVIDLRGLELLDSIGLRTLLDALSSEGGDRISLVQGGEPVEGVFRVSGLLEELPFRPADA
jgi:anti-anti-sigma factor